MFCIFYVSLAFSPKILTVLASDFLIPLKKETFKKLFQEIVHLKRRKREELKVDYLRFDVRVNYSHAKFRMDTC